MVTHLPPSVFSTWPTTRLPSGKASAGCSTKPSDSWPSLQGVATVVLGRECESPPRRAAPWLCLLQQEARTPVAVLPQLRGCRWLCSRTCEHSIAAAQYGQAPTLQVQRADPPYPCIQVASKADKHARRPRRLDVASHLHIRSASQTVGLNGVQNRWERAQLRQHTTTADRYAGRHSSQHTVLSPAVPA